MYDPRYSKPKDHISRYKERLNCNRRFDLWLAGCRKVDHRKLLSLWPSDEVLHNKRHSALLNLPQELLIMIPHYLSPADLLALEASSVRIPKLIPKDAITKLDYLDFADRLDRDAFAQACLEEKAGNIESSDLLCSHCRAFHPPTQPGPYSAFATPRFSAAERASPPERRRCLGAAGKLRVCRHTQLTLEQLATRAGAAPIELLRCDHPSHGTVLEREGWLLAQVTARRDDAFVSRVYFRVEVGGGGGVSGVRAALEAVDEPVCPHLHTADLALEVVEPGSGDSWVGKRYFLKRKDGRRRRACTYSPKVECLTCGGYSYCKLELEVRDKGRRVLSLVSERAIYGYKKVDNPRWLMQLEE